MDSPEQKAAYRLSPEQTLQQFTTSLDGLSASEATKRLGTYGPNGLQDLKTEPLWLRYLRQYTDLMILLLSFSAALSFYLGDTRTGIVLLGIILFNTTLGFLQEFQADRIMQSLEKLVKPVAKAYRDGRLTEVDSRELVPGDIVQIDEGDSIPADLRIIQESELSTNDFALTGESSPSRKFLHAISKEVPLSDRGNLSFMGTTVATGEALGVVIGTGMHTELGRIANLSHSTTREQSPLQRELNHIAGRVTFGVVGLCIILMLVSIQAQLGLQEAFLFAIGLASSLIPQGLPAEVNTSLAQAARRLARARALVKKLSAVEGLGATHIILTDKTGTLTKNQMTVEQCIIGRTTYIVTGTGYEASGHITKEGTVLTPQELTQLQPFFLCGALASYARIVAPDSEHPSWYCLGDPTEGALVTLARKAGIDIEAQEKAHPELKEFTFDSARKRMSSFRTIDGTLTAFVKGSPEGVLEKCTHVWDGVKKRPLTAEDRQWFLAENEKLAGKALRNLAYASRTFTKNTPVDSLSLEQAEAELTLLGMVSMIDPLRDEVPEAMKAAHQAHIKIGVITGDFALTAEAIAQKAGLADGHPLIVVAGSDLPAMDDATILANVKQGGVIFSRVSPEDKLRIVNIVKEAGLVVAVTGDGINDAPALKRADIGVAMGVTGTDVAKQSAEVVLLDDSFHTLVGAVQAGRTIFANIKKGTLSCFTSNTAELIVMLLSLAAASLLGIPLAISVLLILAIDLVAELFPIAALGWDPGEGQTMHEKPRDPKAHILSGRTILDLLWCGLVIGGLAYANYLFFFTRSGVDATTIATDSQLYFQATTLTYVTIVVCQLTNIMQRRSIHGFFSRYQFSNKYFWLAMAFSAFCVLNIVYNPFINEYFKSGALSVVDWGFAFGAAAIFLGIREVQRLARARSRATIH